MITIWHNPRCSKSRAALALLQEAGAPPILRLYLDDPPTLAELRAARAALGLKAVDMMRPDEALFGKLGLSRDDPDDTLLRAMADHPGLIERPIVIAGARAVIGRPPERVRALL